MAGLDVLWHPATSEGLGTAVIDAMALRVPPVAFRVGGLPELIVDHSTGLLVPPGDVRSFAQAAATLVRDADLRRRLGAAGPTRAETFSVTRMAEGTVACLPASACATGHWNTLPPASNRVEDSK